MNYTNTNTNTMTDANTNTIAITNTSGDYEKKLQRVCNSGSERASSRGPKLQDLVMQSIYSDNLTLFQAILEKSWSGWREAIFDADGAPPDNPPLYDQYLPVIAVCRGASNILNYLLLHHRDDFKGDFKWDEVLFYSCVCLQSKIVARILSTCPDLSPTNEERANMIFSMVQAHETYDAEEFCEDSYRTKIKKYYSDIIQSLLTNLAAKDCIKTKTFLNNLFQNYHCEGYFENKLESNEYRLRVDIFLNEVDRLCPPNQNENQTQTQTQ